MIETKDDVHQPEWKRLERLLNDVSPTPLHLIANSGSEFYEAVAGVTRQRTMIGPELIDELMSSADERREFVNQFARGSCQVTAMI